MKSVSVMPDVTIVDILVDTGLAKSKSEAHRLLEDGGIYVNGTTYLSNKLPEFNKDSIGGSFRLRKGKKKIYNEVRVYCGWKERILKLK